MEAENSIVEMARLKMLQEMLTLLTTDEKHAIALQYVQEWVRTFPITYHLQNLIEKELRAGIEAAVRELLASKAEEIASKLAELAGRGVIENEVWQSATWKQEKRN